MLVYWIVISFSAVLFNSDLSFGSTHARIGDWKGLNPAECGVTRWGDGSNMCMRWHKTPAQLKSGRNASMGEAPFTAFLYMEGNLQGGTWSVSCSGSLVARQWIVTAAHCFKEDIRKSTPTMFVALFGYNFTANQWNADRDKLDRGTMSKADFHTKYHQYNITERHVHPNYLVTSLGSNPEVHLHDISLLKLDREVERSVATSVCLPAEFIKENSDEYAMLAGYGHHTDKSPIGSMPLQIGHAKISTALNLTIHIMTLYERGSEQSLICKGDSGGPMWQFYMGRAVLIGIVSMTKEGLTNDCQKTFGIEARVSRYIDFIIGTTKLDTQHLTSTGHTVHFTDYFDDMKHLPTNIKRARV